MKVNQYKIKAHFWKFGYEISILKHYEKHIITWQNGGPVERLATLLEYYFCEVDFEAMEFGQYLVTLDNFNPEGHGISGICRKCGCAAMDACHDHETGTCWWVQQDLCSACATKKERAEAIAEMEGPDPDDSVGNSKLFIE